MIRKKSHFQGKEPILEYILSEIRKREASKYIKKNDTVLDLGCGYNGSFLKKISRIIKLGVGFDISVNKIGPVSNVALKRSNLNENFGKSGGHFNIVTALAVIEHVEKPDRFVSNIWKVLKPGGKLIITTPHKLGKPILEIILYRLGLIDKNEINDHKNYFDKTSLKSTLENGGFKVLKIYNFGIAWLNIFCLAQKLSNRHKAFRNITR